MEAFSELGVREAAQAIRTGDLTAEALAEALLAPPLPAAKIGEDDTVLLNGVPVPSSAALSATFARAAPRASPA
jgi:hypothetical protein